MLSSFQLSPIIVYCNISHESESPFTEIFGQRKCWFLILCTVSKCFNEHGYAPTGAGFVPVPVPVPVEWRQKFRGFAGSGASAVIILVIISDQNWTFFNFKSSVFSKPFSIEGRAILCGIVFTVIKIYTTNAPLKKMWERSNLVIERKGTGKKRHWKEKGLERKCIALAAGENESRLRDKVVQQPAQRIEVGPVLPPPASN